MQNNNGKNFYFEILFKTKTKKMVSVKHIIEYVELPREPMYNEKTRTRSEWPNKGRIEFRQVSMRPDDYEPQTIKKLTAQINPREKLGVVERPVIHHSWFNRALFRLYEPSGNITIDFVDTKELGLYELRSRIGILSVHY